MKPSSTSVDNDQELNSLLINAAMDSLKTDAEAMQKLQKELSAKVESKVADYLAVVLAMYPTVHAISWTQSTGEYNDQTYDGFTIGYVVAQPTLGSTIVVSSWNGVSRVNVNEVVGEAAEESNQAEVEWYEIDDVTWPGLENIMDIFRDYVTTFDSQMEYNWGNSVRVIADRDGLKTEEYYNN